ncbi:hypothetical protein [Micromonospora globbae]|uniref:hypothetical protein n=1 Tax=Micromonospora globbae TaxID=1894969 RepID=UPI0034222FB6
MERLIALLPVLGCLAMGVMMWLMMRGQHGPTQHGLDPATQEEINRLRAEVALLKQDRTTTGHDAGEPGARP